MTLAQRRGDTRHDWWRGATLYQIYPRSFMDANGDGIGDLPGIAARLEHIASLGVDAIWLSPFFTSPMDDFGYDISDYRDVDPMFGTLDDFRALIDRAHDLGLRVLIDQVLSHSSDRHPWFAESRANRDNPRADWYVWADPKPDGNPPNNWLAAFGGPAWTFDSRRCQYYLHNFLPSQPDLDFHHPEVQQAQLDNLRFWLELGVDGFRFDVVNFYFHDRALTDNPPSPDWYRHAGHPRSHQLLRHNTDQPENLAFLERVRTLLDEFPGAASVGEVGGSDPLTIMAAYTAGDSRLHMAYTFDLLGSTGDARQLHDVLARFADFGDDTWPCWALSNHDVARSASRWGEARALLALTVLASLRGSLCLYQGEELGLPEAELAYEDLQDPFGINLWPEIKGRDGCRTPMPWKADTVHAGFSPATPWLPVASPHRPLAVDRQDADPDSLLNRVRQLFKLRGESLLLRQGDQQLIDPAALPEDIFALLREHDGHRLLCLAHLGRDSEPAPLAPDTLVDDFAGWHSLALPGMPVPEAAGHRLLLAPGTAVWLALH
ncbi:alpha-amylase family glycosyl hydrolase [Chromohalobacter israelensis]|uniref:alpha-amylase family glycosyl hydrolase n=1 Tax=Chromohalobacter israelensis TaxID=141390 RepID=UPI0005596C03|nr:alpha-amylase family glycosyl hydrolase [Chromohalobacter israelensis]MDF9434920.1 alpha-amylase family glycosyl hydrolase [Chromohalobacter israelensis]